MLGLGIGFYKLGGNDYPGGWSPKELGNLLNWYKFDTGQTINGEGNVTEWADQEGSNHLAASGDAETSPTGTDGAVVFDSAGDIMDFTDELSLGTFSIYMRCEFDGFNSENMIEKGATDFIKLQTSSTVRLKIDNNRHDYNLPATISNDTKFNLGWERENTGDSVDDRVSIFLNGVVGTQSGTGDGTQVITDLLTLERLGKPTQDSKWYEIVICSDALSDADRALLNTYFDSI